MHVYQQLISNTDLQQYLQVYLCFILVLYTLLIIANIVLHVSIAINFYA